MKRACLCILGGVAMLGGCASEFQVKRATPLTRPIGLGKSDSVYVVVPQDGQYGSKAQIGSGRLTADAAARLFGKYAGRVAVGSGPQTAAEGLAEARAQSFSHCTSLQIFNWEDRATEWSGKQDRASLSITLQETQGGKVLDSAVVTAVGTWWTFGGLHPEDLLDRMMAKYGTSAIGDDVDSAEAP